MKKFFTFKLMTNNYDYNPRIMDCVYKINEWYQCATRLYLKDSEEYHEHLYHWDNSNLRSLYCELHEEILNHNLKTRVLFDRDWYTPSPKELVLRPQYSNSEGGFFDKLFPEEMKAFSLDINNGSGDLYVNILLTTTEMKFNNSILDLYKYKRRYQSKLILDL